MCGHHFLDVLFSHHHQFSINYYYELFTARQLLKLNGLFDGAFVTPCVVQVFNQLYHITMYFWGSDVCRTSV